MPSDFDPERMAALGPILTSVVRSFRNGHRVRLSSQALMPSLTPPRWINLIRKHLQIHANPRCSFRDSLYGSAMKFSGAP